MLSYTKVLKKIRPAVFTKNSAGTVRHISTNYYRAMTASVMKQKNSGSYGQSKSKRNYMFPAAALGLLSLVGGWEMLKKKLSTSTECCGIIGYVGQDNIAGRLVLDGLQILQYRGYDS